MRVLVLSQHFWPESFRINQVVKSLTEAGCSVTVLTGQPNYPQGRVFTGYSAWSLRKEKHADGYLICRVPLLPRGRASAMRLSANYASFVLSAAVFGPWLLREVQFDVIFVYAPSPILQAIPAVLLKWLKKARLVTWVQDLWPESIESTGYIRNPHVLKVVEHVVRWIYRHNDLLLGQSRSFVTSIGELAGGTRVEYFPNPGEASLTNDATSEPALRLQCGFNVVFAGNLGTVQALDTVLAAAELLRADERIRFVLVGSGSRSAWLQNEVAQRGLTNVQLPGRFPAEEIPAILEQASALLVSLMRSPIMSQTIPAKVQAYLAAGRPIIAALDGEGAKLVTEAKAGLSVPAEDAAALADAVRTLVSMGDDERLRMGNAGTRFYQEHFAPDALARQLIERLRQIPSRQAVIEVQ
jgi:glycosyltransferase involved in cell wall biosynthesis